MILVSLSVVMLSDADDQVLQVLRERNRDIFDLVVDQFAKQPSAFEEGVVASDPLPEPPREIARLVEGRKLADPAVRAQTYTEEESAFMSAMDRYKRENRRPFPLWSEVLVVLRSLGYTSERAQPDAPSVESMANAEPNYNQKLQKLIDGDNEFDDYLLLPPDKRTSVERELELVQMIAPNVLISEALRRKTLQDRSLQFYFGGQVVAAVRSERGVVVLAVGTIEIAALISKVPAVMRKGMIIEFPEPW